MMPQFWVALLPLILGGPAAKGDVALRFEVSVAKSLHAEPIDGRLLIVLDPKLRGEPRRSIGRTGMDAPPLLGRDVDHHDLGDAPLIVDAHAAAFPIADLAHLPTAEYTVQAVLDRSRDLLGANMPGNLVSEPKRLRLDPKTSGSVSLELTTTVPLQNIPPETAWVRYVTLPSPRLTAFYGRPISVRAGVILPRDFHRDPDRRYPLRVHIGGFGSRSFDVASMMAEGSDFRAHWLAPETPQMILLHLDGAGPLGDPNQVDSDNHGPFGASLSQELIPHVEARFRGIGEGRARFLDGCSTGGWVSLALQVFYPETFAGAWSSSPDPVDFRDLELINLYNARNAYLNAQGFERPAQRTLGGDVQFTVRHECQLENVLGRGDAFTRSGGQWGSWAATFGPRGADGHPVPPWDPRTGAIDRDVAESWRRYDLRHILESRWPDLGPKLRGKLHISAGDSDEYFLNNAIHRLDDFLRRADPPAEATVAFGPGQGHCALMLSEPELMKQMAAALRPAGDSR